MSKVSSSFVLFCCCFILFVSKTNAGLIWYNGDPNLVTGLTNEVNTDISYSLVYDDFLISSNTSVIEVFSNNFMDFTASEAVWEIRSGMSAGNGGTLIAGGTSGMTQTPNGFNAFGLTGYTITVSGLNVNLTPGTYWLGVAPVGTGTGRSFVGTTSGANAIGSPAGNNGNAFVNSTGFNFNFAPTTNISPLTSDFSMGLSVIPEPSSFALVGSLAIVAITGRRSRRR